MKEKLLTRIRHYIMELYHLITPNSMCDINEYNRLRKERQKISISSQDYKKLQFKTRSIFTLGVFIFMAAVFSLTVYFPKHYQETAAAIKNIFESDDNSNKGSIDDYPKEVDNYLQNK